MDTHEEILKRDLLTRLEDKRRQLWQDIYDANWKRLATRVYERGLHVEYEVENDTLLLTLGSRQMALTESASYGVELRIAPDSSEIVGLEILDFTATVSYHTVIAQAEEFTVEMILYVTRRGGLGPERGAATTHSVIHPGMRRPPDILSRLKFLQMLVPALLLYKHWHVPRYSEASSIIGRELQDFVEGLLKSQTDGHGSGG